MVQTFKQFSFFFFLNCQDLQVKLTCKQWEAQETYSKKQCFMNFNIYTQEAAHFILVLDSFSLWVSKGTIVTFQLCQTERMQLHKGDEIILIWITMSFVTLFSKSGKF